MSSAKRKALEVSLQRRVRARRESSEELESLGSVSPLNEVDNVNEGDSQSEEISDNEDESDSLESEDRDRAGAISFGALAKAQAALNRSGKSANSRRSKDGDWNTWEDNEARERKAGKKHNPDVNRSSKHAPTEISSKKAVSRKREVVPVSKREYRDPRFAPLAGPVDDSKVRKAYSFLEDYREDEMKELKEAIKTTKDDDAKEKLKRALMSMESRKKAQARKDKEREMLDIHRKEEKELVKHGKQPFYLKKTEQKKRLLMDQYGGLKGKHLDHVIERRRKKVEGKEKKKMPFARRNQDRGS